jgi:hypothetical protein
MPETGDKAIREALTTRRLGHDSNELLLQIMDVWGGPAQFARELLTEFHAAKPGSLIRQNILEMIQKLVVNNTNHAITKVIDPADLDDEDIDRELDGMFERAKEQTAARSNPEPQTEQVAWQWAAD